MTTRILFREFVEMRVCRGSRYAIGFKLCTSTGVLRVWWGLN